MKIYNNTYRGAFEFQGQKCSACSRAYIPSRLVSFNFYFSMLLFASCSIWPALKKEILSQVSEIKVGSAEDSSNFVNAVINKRSFDKIKKYIEHAKSSK